MSTLKVLKHNGIRVLTTNQLAESYGADKQLVTNNFNRNKDRYKEGKHFISLQGGEKTDFINQHQIDLGSRNAQFLYLWTEKGAWLHAKSLNTNKAWDAYEMLVDEYYSVKEQLLNTSQLSPELQMFNGLFQSLAKQELATKQLESKVDSITEIVALNTTAWRKDSRHLISKMAQSRGGFSAYKEVNSEIYQEVERRGKFDLTRRLSNKRMRLADEGISKSKRDKLSKVDVIADDKRLVEIYVAVVKEFAIKHGIDSGILQED